MIITLTPKQLDALSPTGKVALAVGQHFGEQVGQARSFDALGADSLDLLEIVMDIEDLCDVDLFHEDLGSLKTVGDLTALVERKIEEKKK